MLTTKRLIGRGLRWLAIALVAIGVTYATSIVVRLWWWGTHNPGSTAFMDSGLARLQAERENATLKHQWMPYERIAEPLKRALIVAEDANFTEHEGFDWEAIERALEKNQKRGKVVAGGSTISQQLAKNLFLSGERSKLRKVQEAGITWVMERLWEKERILEVYLNVIEWGNGVYGCEAAAQHYFKKSASKLSAAESARLAAMVPRPRYYDKNRQSAFLAKKTQWVLRQLGAAELP